MGMFGFGFDSGEVGLKVEGLQSSEHGVSRFADGVKSRTTSAGMLALQESPCLGRRTLSNQVSQACLRRSSGSWCASLRAVKAVDS